MSKREESSLKGLWAVAWRSVVYLPMMIAMFLLFLAHILGLVLLPLFAVICVRWPASWGYAVVASASWLVVLWSWRHFRLGEHFNTPWSSP
jgi:hypothetical protein